MRLLNDTLQDLRSCPRELVGYIGTFTILIALFRVGMTFPPSLFDSEASPALFAVYRLSLTIALALSASVIQAVTLAALGVALDNPLWKCVGPQDALRRFFTPWLIINLMILTLQDIQGRLMLAGLEEAGTSLEFLVLTAHVIAMPAGACIMHYGALEWREMAAILKPIVRLFHLTAIPLSFALVQYLALGARSRYLPGDGLGAMALLSLTDILLLGLDILVFALVWRICIIHRSTPEEEDDNPFDF